MNSHAETLVKEKPKVSIGMPIYNGERFLRKRLDSLLSQTLKDFELIISDNASTDSSPSICEEYARKDARIHFISQKKNMGVIRNFNFVLDEAKSDYFVWASVDDIWTEDFLEENAKVLDSNNKIVVSIGEVEFFDKNDLNAVMIDSKPSNFLKYKHVRPASGSYEEKVKIYLTWGQTSIIYGVFRTNALRKSTHRTPTSAWDTSVILNLLKYGDFHVIDKIMMYKYAKGMSSDESVFNYMRKQKVNILEIIFLYVPFTLRCIKRLGIKIFLKNIRWFALTNFRAERKILRELIKLLKQKCKE